MEAMKTFIAEYIVWFSFPKITVIDILEICVIAFVLYQLIVWVKDTRAWMLVKGMVFMVIVWVVAAVLEMNVLLFVFENMIGVGITAVVIIFQPELRNALEQLGRKGFVNTFTPFDDPRAKVRRLSKESVNSIIRAVKELSETKTGALIVIEQYEKLPEIERTGIILDSKISSQLLLNIFENKTPLHDGAIIIRNERIIAATCYLPLSDNRDLSKELGTRHRAGLGISEVSDALTIIVSEESGVISVAYQGHLKRRVTDTELTEQLAALFKIKVHYDKPKWWKGRKKNEENHHA